jgi:hypothetical protein
MVAGAVIAPLSSLNPSASAVPDAPPLKAVLITKVACATPGPVLGLPDTGASTSVSVPAGCETVPWTFNVTSTPGGSGNTNPISGGQPSGTVNAGVIFSINGNAVVTENPGAGYAFGALDCDGDTGSITDASESLNYGSLTDDLATTIGETKVWECVAYNYRNPVAVEVAKVIPESTSLLTGESTDFSLEVRCRYFGGSEDPLFDQIAPITVTANQSAARIKNGELDWLVPAGSSCTAKETARKYWTNDSIVIGTTEAGNVTVTASNTRTQGSINLSKTVVDESDKVPAALKYAFTISCSNFVLPASLDQDAEVDGIQILLSGGQNASISVPNGAICSVTERAPNSMAPKASVNGGEGSTVVPTQVASNVLVEGTKSFSVLNVFVAAVVEVTKSVTGPVTAGDPTEFTLNTTCSAGSLQVLNTTMGPLANGGTAEATLPAGAVCSVTELDPTGIIAERYTTTTSPVTAVAGGKVTATVTNARSLGSLRISKSVVGVDTTFTFDIACSEGFVPEPSIVSITTNGGSGSATIGQIPTGISCTVTERPISGWIQTSGQSVTMAKIAPDSEGPGNRAEFRNTGMIDLTATMRATADPMINRLAAFEVDVRNISAFNTAKSGWTVTQAAAPGMTITSAGGDGLSCQPYGGATITCTGTGPLAPGQQVTMAVRAEVTGAFTTATGLKSVAWVAPAPGDVAEIVPLEIPTLSTATGLTATNNDTEALVSTSATVIAAGPITSITIPAATTTAAPTTAAPTTAAPTTAAPTTAAPTTAAPATAPTVAPVSVLGAQVSRTEAPELSYTGSTTRPLFLAAMALFVFGAGLMLASRRGAESGPTA